MIAVVKKTIARQAMLPKGSHVIVGLSGGADSVSLLYALLELREELGITASALHIHHGIRGEEADGDLRFCRELCERTGVELQWVQLDIPSIAAERGIGLEQCGRECRYEQFAAAAQDKNAVIATAHTLSDSAETVLFNLARGSGLSGVTGIPPVRRIRCENNAEVTVIRPLINVTREQVEAYCREKSLSYITDSTNADNTYRRNLIRNKVIPALREVNSSLHTAIGRFCECAGEDNALLEQMAADALERCAAEQKNGALSYRAAELSALPEPILRRCIMLIAAQCGSTPEYSQVMLCRRCIAEGSGAVMLTGGLRLCVRDGLVYTDSGSAEAGTGQWEVPLTLPVTVLPDGRQLIFTQADTIDSSATQKHQKTLFKNLITCDIINSNAYVRNRREGDRFAPAGRGHTKRLKKLLCDEGIPTEQRDRLAIIASDSGILWVENFGIAEHARPRETQKAFLVEIKR